MFSIVIEAKEGTLVHMIGAGLTATYSVVTFRKRSAGDNKTPLAIRLDALIIAYLDTLVNQQYSTS